MFQMSKALLFLTDGFEEIEAMVTLDILRRGGVKVTTVSLSENGRSVTGSHDVRVEADELYDDSLAEDADILIMPGGPGTSNYEKHETFLKLLKSFNESKRRIAAICAAPSILGGLGILKGKTAVCYPGYEKMLEGAVIGSNKVETDGHITTSKGPGTAYDFGFALLEILEGKEAAEGVKGKMLYA